MEHEIKMRRALAAAKHNLRQAQALAKEVRKDYREGFASSMEVSWVNKEVAGFRREVNYLTVAHAAAKREVAKLDSAESSVV